MTIGNRSTVTLGNQTFDGSREGQLIPGVPGALPLLSHKSWFPMPAILSWAAVFEGCQHHIKNIQQTTNPKLTESSLNMHQGHHEVHFADLSTH